MNTKDLMKIAKAVYPDEIVEIKDDGVYFTRFLAIDGHKIVDAKFNPKKNMYQLYYCEEWLINKILALKLCKAPNGSYYISFKWKACKTFEIQGKTRAEVILNALLEVIDYE